MIEIENKKPDIEKIEEVRPVSDDPDPNVSYEPPLIINKHNIVYWNPEYKQLVTQDGQKAICTKARRFIEEECIVGLEEGWVCKPIKGYNKTSYKIYQESEKLFKCNCQYNVTTGNMCSHILALIMQLQLWESNKN